MIQGIQSAQFFAIKEFTGTGGAAASRDDFARAVERPAEQRPAGAPQPAGRQETARAVAPASQGDKPKAAGEQELTEEEERQVRDMQQRDREVRAHEQAHSTVGGPYASAPSYKFETGPDGKRYAVSGEVKIDTAPVRDNPEATIRKMDVVIRAALAPAEPSSQDLQVARQAQAERAKAQAELTKQRQEEVKAGPPGSGTGENASGKGAPTNIIAALKAYHSATSRAQSTTAQADTDFATILAVV